MSNGSPAAYLLWSILACMFFVFLLVHLWAYDRFKCLKWDSGRQPGAFKRVMTYSYVATLPLLVVFSITMCSLKFKEGYIMTPTGLIMPNPLSYWAPNHKHWLLPTYFVLSVAWSLELVTHLEELTFWLFLLHQGPGKRDWFHSWEFRTWYLGSIIAVLGMPLVALLTRQDIDKVQVWIFLAGSIAGTSTTTAFLYVLFHFPSFIRSVKAGGAEPDVVVRLATFFFLNKIRVIFRFLFTVPLLIIAVDGIGPPYLIIGNSFALDFLLMVGGLGCFISSAITLLVFFPRSITRESGYTAKIISPPNYTKAQTVASPLSNYYHHEPDTASPKTFLAPRIPAGARMHSFRFPEHASTPQSYSVYQTQSNLGHPRTSVESESSPGSDAESIAMASTPIPFHLVATQQSSPQTATSGPTSGGLSDDTVWERPEGNPPSTRRRHSDGPFVYNRHGFIVATNPDSIPPSDEGHRSSDREHNPPSTLHPYVINFTSPIDLLDEHPLSF